jgi:hypothetical protein
MGKRFRGQNKIMIIRDCRVFFDQGADRPTHTKCASSGRAIISTVRFSMYYRHQNMKAKGNGTNVFLVRWQITAEDDELVPSVLPHGTWPFINTSTRTCTYAHGTGPAVVDVTGIFGRSRIWRMGAGPSRVCINRAECHAWYKNYRTLNCVSCLFR